LNCKSDDQESDNRRDLTGVLNAHGSYSQHMSAAFQYNLKRRAFFRFLKFAGHRIGHIVANASIFKTS
jgi:hypothetical protein